MDISHDNSESHTWFLNNLIVFPNIGLEIKSRNFVIFYYPKIKRQQRQRKNLNLNFFYLFMYGRVSFISDFLLSHKISCSYAKENSLSPKVLLIPLIWRSSPKSHAFVLQSYSPIGMRPQNQKKYFNLSYSDLWMYDSTMADRIKKMFQDFLLLFNQQPI